MTKEDREAMIRRLESLYKEAVDNSDKEALFYAIEALQENESLARSVNEASELLRKKRPQATWIEIKDEDGITYCGCSNCSFVNEHWQTQWVACPNCGASMKKECDGK